MTNILTPCRSLPAFVTTASTLVIVLEGTTDASPGKWTAKLTDDLGAEWPLTITAGTTVTEGVQLSATLPGNVPPDCLNLVVTYNGATQYRTLKSVAVKATLTPSSGAIIRVGWHTDEHLRYLGTPPINFEVDETKQKYLYRSDKLIENATMVWTTLNPWVLINTGDLTHEWDDTNSLDNASFDHYQRYVDVRQALRVPSIIVPGNHDMPYKSKRGNFTTLTRWLSHFGRSWGVVDIASNFRVIAHDYGDPDSLAAMTAALAQAFTGVKLLAQHYDSDGSPWFCITDDSAATLEVFGHLHSDLKRDSNSLQGAAAYQYAQGWIFNWTRSGSTYTNSDAATWKDGTDMKRICGSDGLPLLNLSYTAANNGTADTSVATVDNRTGFVAPDGRVRFIMANGTYTVTGGTKVAEYNLPDGKTVVLVEASLPGSGTVLVGVERTGGSTGGGGQTGGDPTPAPKPTTVTRLRDFLFYGVPTKDQDGTSRAPGYFANKMDGYFERSRNRMNSDYAEVIANGYTGPTWLYQRAVEVILDQSKVSSWGSQWNDGSGTIQPLADAVNGDSTCFLYSTSASASGDKIKTITDNGAEIGYYLVPNHPKVVTLIKTAALKYLQAYPTLAGLFLDNIDVYTNAKSKSSSGKVYYKSGSGSVQLDRAALDSMEQDLYRQVRTYVNANLGRAWTWGGNLLYDAQTTDWRKWDAFDFLMIEGLVGYADSPESSSRVTTKITLARQWLASNPNRFLFLVNQVPYTTSGSTVTPDAERRRYGKGVAMLIDDGKDTSQGYARVYYRDTCTSGQYYTYWTPETDYEDYGPVYADPVISGSIGTRRLYTGQVSVDTSARDATFTIMPVPEGEPPPEPDPEDPPPDPGTGQNGSQFDVTIVSLSEATPTTPAASGTPVVIDGGSTRQILFGRVAITQNLPPVQNVQLVVPVAVGTSAKPHAQLVSDFTPATVTWNTRPAALDPSVPLVNAIVSDTTASFDLTALAQRMRGNVLAFAILLGENARCTLHPTATLVWNGVTLEA